ncbi:MAG: ECF transporter S component [Coriobacteriia bacterium]|nr:ECF transporter S component [Coriobacteriia bacterium]
MQPGRLERSPKQFAALIILALMAMVMSFIQLSSFPGAEWLKYDPSGVVVLLAGFLYGPWYGAAVAAFAWAPQLATSPFDAIMNTMFSVSYVVVTALVYRQAPRFMRAVLGICAGILAAVTASICLNFVVTPFYLSRTYEDVVALVLPTLLPFNLGKAVLNGVIALIAYRGLESLLTDEENRS